MALDTSMVVQVDAEEGATLRVRPPADFTRRDVPVVVVEFTPGEGRLLNIFTADECSQAACAFDLIARYLREKERGPVAVRETESE